MKTKDIQPGIVYARRGGTQHDWAVPYSVELRYELGSFDDRLCEGKALLVLAPGSRGAITQRPADPASKERVSVRAAALEDIPYGTRLNDLNERLNDRGVHAELWLPSQFEGEYDDVTRERQKAASVRDAADEAKWRRQDALEARWDKLRADLDVNATVRITDVGVVFGESGFERVLDRLEAIVAASPLIAGQI